MGKPETGDADAQQRQSPRFRDLGGGDREMHNVEPEIAGAVGENHTVYGTIGDKSDEGRPARRGWRGDREQIPVAEQHADLIAGIVVGAEVEGDRCRAGGQVDRKYVRTLAGGVSGEKVRSVAVEADVVCDQRR